MHAEGGAGLINIAGTFRTGCGGLRPQDLRPDYGREENLLTLRVIDSREDLACLYMEEMLRYRAVLRHLAPGTYRLRIIHVWNTGTRTVFDRDVRVQ
jgi:hypothetical protein